MSRSNPTANNPHPCTRWFEFNGGDGVIEYYDKEKKERVGVPLPFSFLHLDETATVRGWHDASESGIMSNEVRDTRSDVLVVKAFKGGELCSGLYAQIRDRIGNLGGHFSLNLYLGYRDDNSSLKLGCLQLKGAALNQWVEFRKAHQGAIITDAITILGTNDGKKGSVSYKTPVFGLKPIKPETNDEAVELDKVLQTYLTGYFGRTKTDQVSSAPAPDAETTPTHGILGKPVARRSEPPEQDDAPPEEDDVPF